MWISAAAQSSYDARVGNVFCLVRCCFISSVKYVVAAKEIGLRAFGFCCLDSLYMSIFLKNKNKSYLAETSVQELKGSS